MEQSKECFFDQLTIYDGPSLNDSLLIPPLCGNDNDIRYCTASSLESVYRVDTGFSAKLTTTCACISCSQTLSSSSNEVLVTMTSDHDVQDEGFQLSYSQDGKLSIPTSSAYCAISAGCSRLKS